MDFLNKNQKFRSSQTKLRHSFYLRINFGKMAGNKYVDLRKIGNFVRNKCCPEDISKDKGKKADFKKSFENFKIADGHVTYKGKKGDI